MFIVFDICYMSLIFKMDLIISILLISISLVAIFPFLFLGLFYCSFYRVNLFQFFKNISFLLLKSYFFNFLLSLLIISSLFISYFLVINPILTGILGIVLGIFPCLLLLVCYEYLLNIFDLYINKNYHLEFFRKGLY